MCRSSNDDSYGELLLSNHPALTWRASGWKPEYRALPRQIAKALSLRLAANEMEAVQLRLHRISRSQM